MPCGYRLVHAPIAPEFHRVATIRWASLAAAMTRSRLLLHRSRLNSGRKQAWTQSRQESPTRPKM